MPSGFSHCPQMGNELYQSPPSKDFTCSFLTCRDYVPLYDDFMPVNQNFTPVHQDLTPVHQDLTPVYQNSIPVYLDSKPVCAYCKHQGHVISDRQVLKARKESKPVVAYTSAESSFKQDFMPSGFSYCP